MTSNQIVYGRTSTDDELRQILWLQQNYLFAQVREMKIEKMKAF